MRSENSLPRHQWTDRDRLVLCLFDLLYRNRVNDLALIFSLIKSRILRREGFVGGIQTGSISAQLHEMKNNRAGSTLYNAVSMLSTRQLFNIFSKPIQIIENAARNLSIDLVMKENSERPSPQRLPPARRPVIRSITETTITEWNPDSEDEEDDNYVVLKTPTRRPNLKYLSPILPGSADENSYRRPRLVYRGFQVEHGLTARRYLSDTSRQIPNPPAFKTQSFAYEVIPHLERNTAYSSPFVSLAQNPAVAVKHILAKASEGIPMALAIYQLDDLKDDATARFGPDSGPYLVPVACTQHNLDFLPGGYRGTGEFLVWGSIDCQPVAVVSDVNALMLRAMLRTTRQLSFEAGVRLHKHFPAIPDEKLAELFLYQMLTGWKRDVPKYHLVRRSNAYDEFVRSTIAHQNTEFDENIGAIDDRNEGEDKDKDEDDGFEIIDEQKFFQAWNNRYKASTTIKHLPLRAWRSDTMSLTTNDG